MTASPAGSKSQKSNPKSQKEKLDYGKGSGARDKIVPQPSREPIPMKPRKGLFVTLLVVFVAWVGVLLAMYFTTVRPPTDSPPSAKPPQPTTMTAMTRSTSPETPPDAPAAAGPRW